MWQWRPKEAEPGAAVRVEGVVEGVTTETGRTGCLSRMGTREIATTDNINLQIQEKKLQVG